MNFYYYWARILRTPDYVRHISNTFRNKYPQLYEMFFSLAVKQDSRLLLYASENLQTEVVEKLCVLAVEQDLQAFEYVSENLRTKVLRVVTAQQKIWEIVKHK